MSRTVIILGAGASKGAGAPLMTEFLDVADDLRKGSSQRDKDFDLVFKGKDELQAVHSKATMDLLNLESVFAAFEMAKLLRRLGSLTLEEIDALPDAMTRVIQRTLEATIKFPFFDNLLHPPGAYEGLGTMIATFRDQRHSNLSALSFITFNYDVCLDYSLHFHNVPVNYCLGAGVADAPQHLKILKLHGSLNWARCPEYKKVGCLPVGEFLGGQQFPAYGARQNFKLEVSRGLGRVIHCAGTTLSCDPFVAPPTWNKTQYHTQLESVWQAAARELSDAENIIICGYSLPDTDQFFRYLYALGSVGGSGLKKLWVINPDLKVKQKIESLCGPLALSRFSFFQEPLESGLNRIRELL